MNFLTNILVGITTFFGGLFSGIGGFFGNLFGLKKEGIPQKPESAPVTGALAALDRTTSNTTPTVASLADEDRALIADIVARKVAKDSISSIANRKAYEQWNKEAAEFHKKLYDPIQSMSESERKEKETRLLIAQTELNILKERPTQRRYEAEDNLREQELLKFQIADLKKDLQTLPETGAKLYVGPNLEPGAFFAAQLGRPALTDAPKGIFTQDPASGKYNVNAPVDSQVRVELATRDEIEQKFKKAYDPSKKYFKISVAAKEVKAGDVSTPPKKGERFDSEKYMNTPLSYKTDDDIIPAVIWEKGQIVFNVEDKGTVDIAVNVGVPPQDILMHVNGKGSKVATLVNYQLQDPSGSRFVAAPKEWVPERPIEYPWVSVKDVELANARRGDIHEKPISKEFRLAREHTESGGTFYVGPLGPGRRVINYR